MCFHIPAHKNTQNPASQFSYPVTKVDPAPDFTATFHGSVIILTPITDTSKSWCEANLPDAARWAGGYAIETRYFDDLIAEAFTDGLVFP